MKKIVSLLLALTLVLGCFAVSTAEAAFTPGTYTATGAGYAGPGSVTVTGTVDEEKSTAIELAGDLERQFQARRIPPLLDRDDRLSRDAQPTGEFGLRGPRALAMLANGVRDARGLGHHGIPR